MSRKLLRVSQFAIDIAVMWIAFIAAFLIRFDGSLPQSMTGRLLLTGPYVVALQYCVSMLFGVHRFVWRYVGLREATRILVAGIASSAILVGMRLGAGEVWATEVTLRQTVIPIGVLAINFVLGFMGIAGVRIARRLIGERADTGRRRIAQKSSVQTILVGAGQAGVAVARELAQRPDLGLSPVGFLDDDPAKKGTIIHGLVVLGDTSDLPAICATTGARQALITMSSVPGNVIRRIRRLCEEAGVATKIIPGLGDIVGGSVNLSRIRDINIEDLLRREPVALDTEGVAAYVAGQTVLVTGAGGSIGSELCRQICRFAPGAVILVERAENALFHIHRELTAAHPEVRIVPCIADILDAARMEELFVEHRPALVLHAAAHKHVPMMEWNPIEAIKNNLLGTRVVADLAMHHGVQAFVMISTDKAVNPSSVMGATKRAAEVYVQALAERARGTRFVTVRFGNVLGSAGSVIPIFQEQIAGGGPVTVTHPEMRRYFMTIPEACQLVLEAGAMGNGGEIFILDMGEPVKILDLAREIIALSGLREKEDIDIVFTGTRPGEKLFEELSTHEEHAQKTQHPKIFIGRVETAPWAHVAAQLARVEDALERRSVDLGTHALRQMVPGYTGQGASAKAMPAKVSVGEESAVVRRVLAN